MHTVSIIRLFRFANLCNTFVLHVLNTDFNIARENFVVMENDYDVILVVADFTSNVF